jgi:outer membrane lipopolysaccharide assembly protein LptE/RlpB
MLKKIFILTLFLILTSCGYKAIHSKKSFANYEFSIQELSFVGDREVNLKIKEILSNYTLSEKNKDFVLKISSNVKKVTLAKNIAGDPTTFKSTIIINVEALLENNYRNKIQIVENFTYSNIDNKFDLKRYEKEIKSNLAETATEKLIFKLSNIK